MEQTKDIKLSVDKAKFEKIKTIVINLWFIFSTAFFFLGYNLLFFVMMIVYYIASLIDLISSRKETKNRELIKMTRIKQVESKLEELEKYWQDINSRDSDALL